MDVNMESIIEEQVQSCSIQNDHDNDYGDPEILPRLGDEYQVDISTLMTARDDLEIESNSRNCFNIGLTIPVMWVYNKELSRKETAVKVDSTGNLAARKVELENNGYFLAPGSLGKSWSESECASFLLGLHIFRKNFDLIKMFIGNKEMGDILGYYYGKFYQSSEYIKWSESQKIRSKRYAHGERIFTGWRLQELLSRLFTVVSDDCKNKLTEMSRTFGDGKIPLEEFVFGLKDAVGIKRLVEAVAIGKGKRDLTGNDTTKSNNQTSTVKPSVKAWSMLTSSDIIKYLKGDIRLSKAKSYDLFWEAIWPRLLAREWHSEQPRDHIYSRSNNSLVFLVPGIKKFSRRKLSKGRDYFDSVADVLSKVSSEPALIMLESEELEFEEPDCGSDPRDIENGPRKRKEKRHCYLQPRSSNANQDSPKFTIVDTSLVNVREMRSLPDDVASDDDVSSDDDATSDRSPEAVNLKSQRKVKSLKSNYLVPVKKQRKLTSCTNEESQHGIRKDSGARKIKQEGESLPTACANGELQHGIRKDSGATRIKQEGESHSTVCKNRESQHENRKDSNETKIKQSESLSNGTHMPLSRGAKTEENSANGRRQSTRNRPLTTRALEALECEFLVATKKKRRRKGKGILGNKSLSIHSRRVRAKGSNDTEDVHAQSDDDAADDDCVEL